MANNGNWKTAFQQIAELSQVEAMASIPFGDDFAENRVRLLNELMPKMGVLAPEEAEQLFVAKVMEKSPFLNNTVPREFSSSVVSTTFKKILTRLRAVTSQNPTTQAIRTGVIGAINTWFSGETHPSPPPLQSMGEPVVNTSEGIADPAESSANPVGAPGQQSSGTPEAAGSNVMSEAADEGIESSSVTEVDIMQEFCKLDVGKAMLQEMQARVSDWNQWIHQKGLEKEVFFERYQGPEVPMGYLKLWCMAFGQYGRLSKPDTVVEAVFNKFQELWGPHLPWKAYAECVRHVQQNPHGPVAPVNRSAYSDVGDRLVREKNKLKQVRNEAPTGKWDSEYGKIMCPFEIAALRKWAARQDVAESKLWSATSEERSVERDLKVLLPEGMSDSKLIDQLVHGRCKELGPLRNWTSGELDSIGPHTVLVVLKDVKKAVSHFVSLRMICIMLVRDGRKAEYEEQDPPNRLWNWEPSFGVKRLMEEMFDSVERQVTNALFRQKPVDAEAFESIITELWEQSEAMCEFLSQLSEKEQRASVLNGMVDEFTSRVKDLLEAAVERKAAVVAAAVTPRPAGFRCKNKRCEDKRCPWHGGGWIRKCRYGISCSKINDGCVFWHPTPKRRKVHNKRRAPQLYREDEEELENSEASSLSSEVEQEPRIVRVRRNKRQLNKNKQKQQEQQQQQK